MCFLRFLVIFGFLSTTAFSAPFYYPDNYVNSVENSDVGDEQLKQMTFVLLNLQHQRHRNAPDTMTCDNKRTGECYSQISNPYRTAKKILFGKLHLQKDNKGYYIEDVYCKKEFRENIGPNELPSANKINCEHTWPQSRFSSRHPKAIQKSDLHHLYPTDSRANSIRGSYDFADLNAVGKARPIDNCRTSFTETSSGHRFEPPANHQGNVARALFYFSIRYQIAINSKQEAVLKAWAESDPVDEEEITRNNSIYHIQKNRNPFIDFPELYKRISDF